MDVTIAHSVKEYRQTQLLNMKAKNGIQSALRMAYKPSTPVQLCTRMQQYQREHGTQSKTQDEC